MNLSRRTMLHLGGAAALVTAMPRIASAGFSPTPAGWRSFKIVTRVEIARSGAATQPWVPVPAVTEADWMRAYAEINDFEDQLVSAGAIVVKFWLSVSDEEQLRRFKAREEEAFKRYKITPEDWRNREKWPLYEPAVCDMIDRTSTENAAWTLVEADNKYYARVKILRVLVDKLESALKH